MKLSHDEISQLVYERFAGTISDEDNTYLDQLIESDPEYKKIYLEISNKLESQNAKYIIQNINEQSAWEQVKSNLKNNSKNNSKRITLVKRFLSYAAVGLLILSAGGYFFYRNVESDPSLTVKIPREIQLQLSSGEKINIADSSNKVIYAGDVKLNTSMRELSIKSSSSKSAALNTLVIPKTLTYKVILSDGTAVFLNSSSKLRFPINFQGASRDVYLEGEAYFEVAKNLKMPFIVHTKLTDVKALGTSFNVSAYLENVVTTSLLEGSVITMAKNRKELKLKPGMQAVYSPSEGFIENKFESERVVSWIQGVYNFHDTPLKEIVPIVERWFDIKVNFSSGSVANHRFSGIIDKNQPLEVFLRNLDVSANINSVVENGEITFSRLN